jgi:hypothetical protein
MEHSFLGKADQLPIATPSGSGAPSSGFTATRDLVVDYASIRPSVL